MARGVASFARRRVGTLSVPGREERGGSAPMDYYSPFSILFLFLVCSLLFAIPHYDPFTLSFSHLPFAKYYH